MSSLQVNSESREATNHIPQHSMEESLLLKHNMSMRNVSVYMHGPMGLYFYHFLALKCLYVESPFLATLPIEAARNAVAASRPALRDLMVKPVDRKAPWPGKIVNSTSFCWVRWKLIVDIGNDPWAVYNRPYSNKYTAVRNANIKKCAQRQTGKLLIFDKIQSRNWHASLRFIDGCSRRWLG